jgi:hypothetical protein
MESPVTRRLFVAVGVALFITLCAPRAALAQPAASAQPSAEGTNASNLWITAGVAFATLRGDCQTCEEDYPYRHSTSVLANIGYRVNDRMDVGAEVFWMPAETADGTVRTTHFDAVAQFRPWASQGFFVKGGAGMALIRNWVDVIGQDSFNSKALSVVVGTGWAFRPARRLGLQLFASQHVAALGDLQTADEEVPDIVGNFWSAGIAIVIR